jgi:putative endonuclease
MIYDKYSTGKNGEEKIVSFLKKRGWTILERNFRYQKKEVDIIASKDDIIIFVEVKARNSEQFGHGFEAVDDHKKRHILIVARYYIEKNKLQDINIRFDVASIDRGVVRYIENAFQV